ncbi:MAG: hypothetical protein JWN34_5786 [Bryobacterales bacterium]|nr:hypothetical protein [Bryobacterales bacterium]
MRSSLVKVYLAVNARRAAGVAAPLSSSQIPRIASRLHLAGSIQVTCVLLFVNRAVRLKPPAGKDRQLVVSDDQSSTLSRREMSQDDDRHFLKPELPRCKESAVPRDDVVVRTYEHWIGPAPLANAAMLATCSRICMRGFFARGISRRSAISQSECRGRDPRGPMRRALSFWTSAHRNACFPDTNLSGQSSTVTSMNVRVAGEDQLAVLPLWMNRTQLFGSPNSYGWTADFRRRPPGLLRALSETAGLLCARDRLPWR